MPSDTTLQAPFRLHIPNYLKVPLLLACLNTLICSLTVLTLYFRLQPEIPLFYTLAEPQQHLAPKAWLFFFPLLSTSILLVHLILINGLTRYERVIPKLFTWVTVIIITLILLALLRVLYIIS